jgi:hypothetical protein
MKKDLEYYKKNAEEDYLQVPISVLRYISELEEVVKNCSIHNVVQQSEPLKCDQVCDWERVGHQLNGHQECRTCGKQKAF